MSGDLNGYSSQHRQSFYGIQWYLRLDIIIFPRHLEV
jgi:hypothetical protein